MQNFFFLTSGRKYRGMSLLSWVWQRFLSIQNQKHDSLKKKISWISLNEKLLLYENNIKIMKKHDWRKIFANKTKNIYDKGIISKIYKEHLKLNIRKSENPILKWENYPKIQDIKEDKKCIWKYVQNYFPFRKYKIRCHYISIASLISLLVKNLPTMQETPIWFLG